MPRFVILEHDFPELHWDLMLEAGDALRTWKLLDNPEKSLEKRIKAESSFDHRLLYLDYEGPISNNRGSVERFDFGTFEWLENNKERIEIELKGKKLSGQFLITDSAIERTEK